jgi:hypothetical protein
VGVAILTVIETAVDTSELHACNHQQVVIASCEVFIILLTSWHQIRLIQTGDSQEMIQMLLAVKFLRNRFLKIVINSMQPVTGPYPEGSVWFSGAPLHLAGPVRFCCQVNEDRDIKHGSGFKVSIRT